MEDLMYVRLKPHNPKQGNHLKDYTWRGKKFVAGKWYKVSKADAEYLKSARQVFHDPRASLAFDVCTEEEAKEVVLKERVSDGTVVVNAQPEISAEDATDEAKAARRKPKPKVKAEEVNVKTLADKTKKAKRRGVRRRKAAS